MTNRGITDEQASALLGGHLPQGREDLEQLAALVGELRLECFETPPRPSAALAARLDLDRLAWVSTTRSADEIRSAASQRVLPPRPSARRGGKRALGWFTGLGIAAQLAMGAGAVGASAAGIGMAGALPAPAQQVFDAVVGVVAPEPQRPGAPAGPQPVGPVVGADEQPGTGGSAPNPTGKGAHGANDAPADERSGTDTGGTPRADGAAAGPDTRSADPDRPGADAGTSRPVRPGGGNAEADAGRGSGSREPSTPGAAEGAERETPEGATPPDSDGDHRRTGLDSFPGDSIDGRAEASRTEGTSGRTPAKSAETADIGQKNR